MKHSPILSPTPTDFHIFTSNNNVMDMGMDVHNSSELSVFFLLSSTLYKEPYRAIVRELVSNAIDASKRIGTKESVVLHVPKTLNDINNEFYVQDFGIGMSLEQVINIYGNYFASSKQNDSNSIGGFGLGGKTPFIYVKDSTDGFKLETTSPEDGIRRTFMFYMVNNEHNGLKPVYRYLEHLDVENSPIKGSKVSFKLHDIDDIANFTNAIDDVLLSLYPIQYTGIFEEENVFDSSVHKWMKKNLNLNLTLDQSKEIYSNLSYDKMKKLNDSFYYFDYPLNFRTISGDYFPPLKINHVSLILGNIFYQYTLDDNDKINQKIQELNILYRHISKLDKDYQVDVGLPIFQSDDNGNITLALSRENIQKTEYNDKIIIDTVNQYLDDKVVKVKECLINMLEKSASTINYNYKTDNLYNYNGLYGAYQELINVLSVNQYYLTLPQLILDELSFIKKQYENMIKKLSKCFIAESYNDSFIKQSFEQILRDVERNKRLRYEPFNDDHVFDNINTHDYKLVFLIDSVSKIKTRKQKDIVFENFLNQHINKRKYSCHIVMSQEQFDIVSKFGTQFKQVIDLNPSINPLIEEWKSNQLKTVQNHNNKSEKDARETIKSKLFKNESNGFYLVDFEDGFKRNIEQVKQPHDLFPKHLNLDIVIRPILLPKTIKLNINHRLDNLTFIKNIQLLIKIGALRLNDKNILINEAFLSKTNDFICKLLKGCEYDNKKRFFLGMPTTVFRPISNIIPFNFIDNNQFEDLDNIDIFQYINDEINERLDDVYKQLNKQINFKDFFFTSVAKRIFFTYHCDVRRIFSPFEQLMTKDEKILKDILLNKMADVSEEVVNQYFNDEQPIMKYMMFSYELGGFVDYLKYHFKHMGLSKKIKTFDDFFEKHGVDIINKIQFRFPHDKINKAGFKYSKELYLDYVKPLLTSFDEK